MNCMMCTYVKAPWGPRTWLKWHVRPPSHWCRQTNLWNSSWCSDQGCIQSIFLLLVYILPVGGQVSSTNFKTELTPVNCVWFFKKSGTQSRSRVLRFKSWSFGDEFAQQHCVESRGVVDKQYGDVLHVFFNSRCSGAAWSSRAAAASVDWFVL